VIKKIENKRTSRKNKLPRGGEFKVIPNLLLIGNLRHFIWQFLRSHEGTLASSNGTANLSTGHILKVETQTAL
jgi:hypothetical protein